jgi:hypothetical protein
MYRLIDRRKIGSMWKRSIGSDLYRSRHLRKADVLVPRLKYCSTGPVSAFGTTCRVVRPSASPLSGVDLPRPRRGGAAFLDPSWSGSADGFIPPIFATSFDKIKIDRCFISGLADGDDSRSIVQAIRSPGEEPRHHDDC